MNYIFYQTKTMFSNTGDALINHALIKELRGYGKICANCSSDVPQEFLQALGIKEDERVCFCSEFSFVKGVVAAALKAKQNGDRVFVFSGPGDMYGGSLKLAVRNIISGFLFPIFRICGVTVVRIGRSLGPISRLMAVSEWFRSLSLSYTYVRDNKSLLRCRKIGIKKAKFCPDMSWLYHKGHHEFINHTGNVMVNLRNSIFDNTEEKFIESTLKQCDRVLCELNKKIDNMRVIVAYQVDGDSEFSKRVYDFFKDKYTTEFIDCRMKLDDFPAIYGNVDFHISNRMHSLLVGYKYGSLPIALIDKENHTKISATFADCDLESLIVDLKCGETQDKVSFIYENTESLMNQLFICETCNQNRITEELNMIFG